MHAISFTRLRVPRLAAAAVAASLVTTLVAGTAGTARANPGDGTPGQTNGTKGDLWITSSTSVAKGQKISFAGENLELNNGVAQKLSLKWDAFSSTQAYTGVGHVGGIGGTFQVQADGTVSGSLVVPQDLDDAAVNGTADGPHFLRLLGGAPATSIYSEDFTLDAAHSAAPTATATAATTSSRGTNAVTITVAGTGFVPGEDVSVARALADSGLKWTTGTGTAATTVDTIKAGADGSLAGKIVLGFGVLGAGEHQLVFSRSSDAENPATAQVTVSNHAALANIALGSQGTLTVSNLMQGATYSSLKVDPDPAVTGDEVEVLDAPVTASAAGIATGTFTLPEELSLLGTKTFVLAQSTPVASTQTLTAKVSPSSALLNEAGFEVTQTSDPIEQGLYQSAYSAASKALFVASANVTSTSTLYKVDPKTLKVIDSAVPAEQEPGKKWAAYGVGVDDVNGNVWVSNTRQNTLAVYKQSDLSLVKQFPAGTLTHTRDVVTDTKNGVVYVSSASEGTTGQGAIGMFEADDKDGDGIKYEHIKNVAVHNRTEFSPVSLELDLASRKLFSPSLTSNKVAVLDLDSQDFSEYPVPASTTDAAYQAEANEHTTLLTLPDLTVGGRGASGIAYDHVTGHLFIASQNSDELMVAKVNDTFTQATTVKEIATGAGALNVAFDPVHRLVYVTNFGGTTVSVLDPQGNRVANLPITRANHVAEDGLGNVFVVNKDTNNTIYKISPKTAPATLTAGTPKVTGTARVGAALTAAPGTWTQGATLRYQWLAGGQPVAGATARTLTLKPAQVGKKISVRVTGSLTGYTTVVRTSAATAAVKPGVLRSTKPKLTGQAKVGKTLKVARGTWTKGTKFSYRWTANGKVVKGATKASLKLTRALKGKKVAVRVTGKLAGHTSVTKASAARKVR